MRKEYVYNPVTKLIESVDVSFLSILKRLVPHILGSLFIGMITIFIFYYFQDLNKKTSTPFENKLEELEIAKSNLENISQYLEEQKNIIIEQEQIIEDLNNKKKELEPFIKANQDEVNAILSLYKKSQKSNIWLDRFFAVLIGIISSLLATYIYNRYSKRKGLSKAEIINKKDE